MGQFYTISDELTFISNYHAEMIFAEKEGKTWFFKYMVGRHLVSAHKVNKEIWLLQCICLPLDQGKSFFLFAILPAVHYAQQSPAVQSCAKINHGEVHSQRDDSTIVAGLGVVHLVSARRKNQLIAGTINQSINQIYSLYRKLLNENKPKLRHFGLFSFKSFPKL